MTRSTRRWFPGDACRPGWHGSPWAGRTRRSPSGAGHCAPVAPHMGDDVADRVVLQVADVRLAARVRQLLEDVGPVFSGRAGGDLPGALGLPQPLPARLDRVRVELVEHGELPGAAVFLAHRPRLGGQPSAAGA